MLVPGEHLPQACESPQFPAAMTQIHCKGKTMELIKSASLWEVCLIHMPPSSYERNLKYIRTIFQTSSRFLPLPHRHRAHNHRNPMCWTSQTLHSLNTWILGYPSFPKRSFKYRFNWKMMPSKKKKTNSLGSHWDKYTINTDNLKLKYSHIYT